MTTRRSFLGTMLGAMAAPAIVRAESLMKIYVPNQQIFLLNEKYMESFVVAVLVDRPAADKFDRRSWGQLIVTDMIVVDTRLSPDLITRRLDEHRAYMLRNELNQGRRYG